MNTAVHPKASLADVLLADGASDAASVARDREQTNTVDFGTTLMSLVVQAAAGKNSGTSAWSAKNASTALDAKTTQVDPRFSKVATTPKIGSESHAPATTQKVASQTSSARSDSFAAVLDGRTVASHSSDVAADASDDALSTTKTSADDAIPTRTSSGVATGNPDQSLGKSAATAIVAQSGFAAVVDAPVPSADIAGDQKSQPASPKATGDPASSSAQGTSSASNFATVVKSAQIDSNPDLQVTATPRTSDSSDSHNSRPHDGTSDAPSTQGANSSSMNPANPKTTQQTSASLTTDAAVSSAKQSPQEQMDAVAQIMPQDQRERNATTKDPSTQTTDLAALTNDSAGIIVARPTAQGPQVAAIRLTPEVASASEPSRTVSITVQLASGQTAQASVRERAGAVDVKIVTPTAASAERVSSEMDGLRQSLDAAGIKLGHSEISYQPGDGKGQGREGYQPRAQNQSDKGKEVFVMNEVNQ